MLLHECYLKAGSIKNNNLNEEMKDACKDDARNLIIFANVLITETDSDLCGILALRLITHHNNGR